MSQPAQQAREALGQRLREIRQNAGHTGRRLASLAGWHYTKVSKLENAVTSPSEADIHAWCSHCSAEEQIPELIATIRNIDGMYVEWRRRLSDGLKQVQESSFSLYEQNLRFRIYEASIIPGLLQNANYIAATLQIADNFYNSSSDVDAAVATRVERQRFLYQGDRRFLFLVEESALRTVLGSREVLLGQLDRLLAVMNLPRVSLGVIPAQTPRELWPGESFLIFDEHTVRIETTSAHLTITQPREIALYVKAFSWLERSALYGDQARVLIREIMAEIAAT
ncbi:helix-turn-helix domain-containing protein [Salinactinospora qingdaonensis]|uniref:Helix-turn-helix transcriptional regulator n=1 Tax=Salinactinospora qingdaonensis TaxID=702744 RepID=A0ABP7FUV9_9ACTN